LQPIESRSTKAKALEFSQQAAGHSDINVKAGNKGFLVEATL
jgi:hypothetical protein